MLQKQLQSEPRSVPCVREPVSAACIPVLCSAHNAPCACIQSLVLPKLCQLCRVGRSTQQPWVACTPQRQRPQPSSCTASEQGALSNCWCPPRRNHSRRQHEGVARHARHQWVTSWMSTHESGPAVQHNSASGHSMGSLAKSHYVAWPLTDIMLHMHGFQSHPPQLGCCSWDGQRPQAALLFHLALGHVQQADITLPQIITILAQCLETTVHGRWNMRHAQIGSDLSLSPWGQTQTKPRQSIRICVQLPVEDLLSKQRTPSGTSKQP
jgi:hypothetical protein